MRIVIDLDRPENAGEWRSKLDPADNTIGLDGYFVVEEWEDVDGLWAKLDNFKDEKYYKRLRGRA